MTQFFGWQVPGLQQVKSIFSSRAGTNAAATPAPSLRSRIQAITLRDLELAAFPEPIPAVLRFNAAANSFGLSFGSQLLCDQGPAKQLVEFLKSRGLSPIVEKKPHSTGSEFIHMVRTAPEDLERVLALAARIETW
jgi:cell division septation protein DedD